MLGFSFLGLLLLMVWSFSLMSFFGRSKEKTVDALVPVKPQADINIFTVASGLLYEVA